jgi:hypothetical protein
MAHVLAPFAEQEILGDRYAILISGYNRANSQITREAGLLHPVSQYRVRDVLETGPRIPGRFEEGPVPECINPSDDEPLFSQHSYADNRPATL